MARIVAQRRSAGQRWASRSEVVLAAHTGWHGDAGRDEAMWDFVGRAAVVTSLGGLDAAGCTVVRVDVDGGAWAWRTRNLFLRSDL